ncbi:MAG: fumarate hydratase [Methanobrevibacter sp.]|uniref:fumarate hydratase n=1 Tax=Methanobrevibacter sp. TaxID=66852 RepID=UPI0026E0C4C0|nr:fumarate hydratase [Methanobrevibacter sp.]MDO5848921.1 fumarate hydratase [Methanobrevibacter sp.]
MDIVNEISNAIIEASVNFPKDRERALNNAIKNEDNENAIWVLNQLLENYKVGNKQKLPLCDDTGIPHVILEVGSEREITGELLNNIYGGIELGLNNLPARPMAVKGNDKERLSQSKGLFERPGKMKPAPFIIDTENDFSSYGHEIDSDTLNIHFILEGGGPEIRGKTYRVFHKRSYLNVLETAIDWLGDSLEKLGCTPSIPAIGIGRTHFEASTLLLKSIAYGNLDNQSEFEEFVSNKLNQLDIGPMGLGGKTTVLGSFVNVGNQRASGVRIVSIRPSCCVEPRVAKLALK